ncbi:MAG: GNAT family N-acetyltransferase [Elusimicrobia bacterium]|nr:GNAT family N-acetyltransferase [Elusimicrobiota bacterium]
MAPGTAVVETLRLDLREFEESDWPAFRAVSIDPEAERVWGEPVNEPFLRQAFSEALSAKRRSDRHVYALAVVLRTTGEIVGYVDFSFSPGASEAEFSIMLGGGYRGLGFGSEVCRAMIGFGFGALGMRRVFSSVDAANPASRRMLEKAGMRLEREWRRPADAPPGSSWAVGCMYVIRADAESRIDRPL